MAQEVSLGAVHYMESAGMSALLESGGIRLNRRPVRI